MIIGFLLMNDNILSALHRSIARKTFIRTPPLAQQVIMLAYRISTVIQAACCAGRYAPAGDGIRFSNGVLLFEWFRTKPLFRITANYGELK
jgi:hypothetical protein